MTREAVRRTAVLAKAFPATCTV